MELEIRQNEPPVPVTAFTEALLLWARLHWLGWGHLYPELGDRAGPQTRVKAQLSSLLAVSELPFDTV